MRVQHDLFNAIPTVTTVQAVLFDAAACPDTDATCGQCDRPLMFTDDSELYLACPAGHGKLIPATMPTYTPQCCWCDLPATRAVHYGATDHPACDIHPTN